MADRLPVQSIGKWTFHLEQAQSLQLHITAQQEDSASLVIEGHDISSLLDYLFNNRDAIYEATHDQETRRIEAKEAHKGRVAIGVQERQVERIFYLDEGAGRTRANI